MKKKLICIGLVLIFAISVMIAGCTRPTESPDTENARPQDNQQIMDDGAGDDLLSDSQDEGLIDQDSAEAQGEGENGSVLNETQGEEKDEPLSSGTERKKKPQGASKDLNRIKTVQRDNEALAGLLPDTKGFKWIYNGFVDYGHTMVLKGISNANNKIVYDITGEVDDLSGGESKRDYSLQIQYIIQDGILYQVKTEEMMMDSISDNIQLLKAPLKKNVSWTQTVKDKEGKNVEFECEITNIEEIDGLKQYTVVYSDKNSKYYEKRRIKEGTGVVFFEKLYTFGEESMEIGYSIYQQ